MKNSNYFAIAISVFALAFWTTSCQEDELVNPVLNSHELTIEEGEIQATTLGTSATINGKPIKEYTKDWWKYAVSFDCAHNPLFGLSAPGVSQTGPVHCVVGVRNGISTRNIVVDKSKTLLVPVINVLKSYPSPDPAFKPAPGQSIDQFLKREASTFVSQVTDKRVYLDGKPINITGDNRFSTNLFTVKGNKDLVNCLDCITGNNQSAISDGYWVAVKDLGKGNHTLQVIAEAPKQGIKVDATYHINVR